MGIRGLKSWQIIMLAVFCWFGATSSAIAAKSEVAATSNVSAQLIFAKDGVAPEAETLSAALVVDLEPGWKTYWRSPGEVGLPPTFDWSESKNLQDVQVLWPAPTRFDAFGIENFGYQDRVVFPLRVALSEAGKAAEAVLALDLLVCSDVCVPRTLHLDFSLPQTDGWDAESADLIATALASVPTEGPPPYVTSIIGFTDNDLTELVVELRASQSFGALTFFPELGPDTALGKPDIRYSPDNRTAWARFPISYADPDTLQPLALTVVEEGGAAFAVSPAVMDVSPVPPTQLIVPGIGINAILWYALIALLGGMILNVMPCVLPVLAIKVSSLAGTVDRSRNEHRSGLIMTTLGVLTFMWSLALVLVLLKAFGSSIGWGVQFQSPTFLAIALTILLLFAGNLFGIFEISLPSWIQTRMGRAGGSSLAGDFLTGFFAALLATPCSAPFLGTAVAFAFAGRPVDIVIVLTALGVGLAMPYILLAAFPRAAAYIPKPGRWMNWVKWIIGLMLLATVAWLTWVLVGVAGVPAAALALVSGLGLLVVMKFSRRVSAHPLLASLTVVAAVILAVQWLPQGEPVRDLDSTLVRWSQFDRAAIARYVSRGQVVFVDVTADWCVTCKVNKALVIERDPVRTALNSPDVIAMQADWTRPDDKIAQFLQDNNRYGIPFNAVYGPNAPNGILLSEVLTPSAVMDAIKDTQLSDLQEKLFQLTNSSFNP